MAQDVARIRPKVPTVLTIAGSDSAGGAGIQGDLKTFQAFNVYGLSVVTAVTAQNTLGVLQVYDLPVAIVARQLEAVAGDIDIQAAKTGMLSNVAIIGAVASAVGKYGIQDLVIDPVMRAKSGDPLIAADAEQALAEYLLPLARVVTPNLPEAERLAGMEIESRSDMKRAARLIHRRGCSAVLVKGGHLESETKAVDVLFDGEQFHEFAAMRVDIPGGVHGTGCAYSSAIAAGLAEGRTLLDAISRAKEYITGAIMRCYSVGGGHPVLDHSWKSQNINH